MDMAGNKLLNVTIDDATQNNQPASFRQIIKKFTAGIGDGITTSFTLTHGLNTQDINVQIRETSTPYNIIYPSAYMDSPNVQVTGINSVTIIFAVAPTTNQFRVIILG